MLLYQESIAEEPVPDVASTITIPDSDGASTGMAGIAVLIDRY